MKRIRNKMRRLRMTRWNKLTLGEKIIRVVISLLKVAAIAAVAITIAGVVVAVGAGIVVAFAIAGAIGGGFKNASKAYRPGDIYVRFR